MGAERVQGQVGGFKALEAETYIQARAAGASREVFNAALARVPDVLPALEHSSVSFWLYSISLIFKQYDQFMPASYSLDLRTRIAHDFNDNGNAEQVALSYNVSLSSVFKFARLYRENDLAPKSTDPKRLPLILNGQLDDLRTLVKEFSDYKLTQYCDLWFERQGVKVSRSVMDRALTRAGITLKKRLAWRLKKKIQKT